MFTVCKVCNVIDTKVSNGDCDGCNECNAVEQGFYYMSEFEYNDNLVIDEDNNIYDDNMDYVSTLDEYLETDKIAAYKHRKENEAV